MCKVHALTQDQLRKANAPNAYGYVHKYLMQIKWSKADLPKLSAVAMHLKVYGRLTDESQEALTILESHFGGSGHALCTISSLDAIASKTSSKDPSVQQRPAWPKILVAVFETFFVNTGSPIQIYTRFE